MKNQKTDRKMLIFAAVYRSSSGLNGNRDCIRKYPDISKSIQKRWGTENPKYNIIYKCYSVFLFIHYYYQ